MTDHQTPSTDLRHETLAQRKERVLLQCRAYRAAVGQSRRVVRGNLGVDAIAKTAVGLISQRAQNAFSNITGLLDLKDMSAARMRSLLPLLASGYSLLSRRSLLKPVLRGALIVGAAGVAAYWYSTKKSSRKHHEHIALHERL